MYTAIPIAKTVVWTDVGACIRCKARQEDVTYSTLQSETYSIDWT